jgi:hypothetical protein
MGIINPLNAKYILHIFPDLVTNHNAIMCMIMTGCPLPSTRYTVSYQPTSVLTMGFISVDHLDLFVLTLPLQPLTYKSTTCQEPPLRIANAEPG